MSSILTHLPGRMGHVAAVLPQSTLHQIELTFSLPPHLLGPQELRPLALGHWHCHDALDDLGVCRQVEPMLACGIHMGPNPAWRQMHQYIRVLSGNRDYQLRDRFHHACSRGPNCLYNSNQHGGEDQAECFILVGKLVSTGVPFDDGPKAKLLQIWNHWLRQDCRSLHSCMSVPITIPNISD